MSADASTPGSGSASDLRSRVVLALATLGLLAHMAHLWCPTEDGFISYRFARNLAQGHGFVWNVGGPSVEGFTNLALVLFSATVLRLGGDPTLAVPLLCCAATFGVLLGSYRFGRQALGLPPTWALVAPLLLAASGPLAAWASSGLETNLFAFLVLACLACFERALRQGTRRWAVAAALVGFLGVLIRMEGVLVFGFFGSLAWLCAGPKAHGQSSLPRRDLLLAATLFSLLLLALTAWRLWVFGYPLPNTFYAKTGGGLAQARRGAVHSAWFGLLYLAPLLPLLVLRLPGWMPAARTLATRPFAPLACLCLPPLYALYIALVGGDYMAMFRFFVPILAPLYLGLAWVLAQAPRRAPQVLVAGALAAAAMGTFLHSTPLEARLFPPMFRNHGTWRGVQLERWHTARLTAIGQLLARLAPGPEASVFTDAIGAIGYHAPIVVHGQHGLVDPILAHRELSSPPTGLPGHQRSDLAYSLALEPTWFLASRDLSAQPQPYDPSQDPRLDAASRDLLERHYRPRSEWLDDPATGESGWLSFLERN